MFFKCEYVMAMFDNKNSRLMSRLWTFSPKWRSLEGQSPILLVEKVKKIKALGQNIPIIILIFIKKNVQFFGLCPQRARAHTFGREGEKIKALGLKYPNYHSDFLDFAHPPWEKVLIFSISGLQPIPYYGHGCYYGSGMSLDCSPHLTCLQPTHDMYV